MYFYMSVYLSRLNRYGDQLDTAKKEGIKKGFITSIVVGALFLIIFCIFALGF